MPTLTFQGQTFNSEPGETVLDCLLRYRQAIPHGCLAGVCQSCRLRSKDAPPGALHHAQQGLSEQQRSDGEFLACQLPATLALDLDRPQQQRWQTATVKHNAPLSESVWRLELNTRLRWQPGQYFSVSLNGVDARCYSATQSARHGPLVFHIQRYPSGMLSEALCQLTTNDTLQLQGPLGGFRLHDEDSPRRQLFIGSGTGIAPLLAMAREAVDRGTSEEIRVIRCARDQQPFYDSPELSALADSGVTIEQARWGQSDELDTRLRALAPLRGDQIYLSGSAGFVEQFEKRCFLSGAARLNIHKETFLDFGAATHR